MQPHPEISRLLARQKERELIAAVERRRLRAGAPKAASLASRIAVRLRFRRDRRHAHARVAPDAS